MIKEIVQGMMFTLKQAFSKPITVQWPEEQKSTAPRHRGRHILHRYDNGLEKCIGCELCAAACPVGCIYVGAAENDPAKPVSPGERYAERYEINLLRCIYCGYCADACPTEAITLGPLLDSTDYRREAAVVTKEELLEAWSNFPSAQTGENPRGAGADQRGKLPPGPGVSPRRAWNQAVDHEHEANISPGLGGIPVRPPSVTEPGSDRRTDSPTGRRTNPPTDRGTDPSTGRGTESMTDAGSHR